MANKGGCPCLHRSGAKWADLACQTGSSDVLAQCFSRNIAAKAGAVKSDRSHGGATSPSNRRPERQIFCRILRGGGDILSKE
jgi:hypothetical protein